jgi:anti-anti-sigma factor
MFHDIEVSIVCNGAYSVVHVEGDINWKTSPDVRTAILELLEKGYAKRVIVDLTGAAHIDSSGASVLMEGFDVAEERNMDFLLTGLN